MNEKRLLQELEKLTRHLERQNSIQRNFAVGLARGLGTALGATVLFGFALAILFHIVRSIDYVPFLNTLLSSQAVEDIIQKITQPTMQ